MRDIDKALGREERRWWLSDEPFENITAIVRALQERQEYRRKDWLMYRRLYSDKPIVGFSGASYARRDENRSDRIGLNIIQVVIDSATAKIATDFTRAMFLTEGGKWGLRQQAKRLGQFVDGQFYACKVYREGIQAFLRACIYGDGQVKVYTDRRDPENPKIAVDRVFPHEIWVDDSDARYGKPRQLFHVKEVSRDVLLAEYPDKKEAIEGASLINDEPAGEEMLSDPVSVVEAYHLPSVPGAKDGKLVTCTTGGTLERGDWKDSYFPFPWFWWMEPDIGIHGRGLGEQLKGIQIEVNKILRKIQRSMELASSYVLIERGSKIVKEHITNEDWTALEYTGTAPVFATVAAISEQYFQQLWALYQKAFEIAGITQLFASGTKPSGLDSGKALREYKDTQSERFRQVAKSYEWFYMDIATQMLDRAAEIDAETKGGYSVLCQVGETEVERIKWSEVNLDRDKYIMQPHPASFLPKTPAARFQMIKEAGEAFPELQPYLLNMLTDDPDLKAVTKRMNAPIDYIEKVTDRMLYGRVEGDESPDNLEGLYEPPDAFTDLTKAIEIGRGKLLQATMEGCPEERLELLRRYLDEAARLLAPPEQPPMPPDALPPPGAGAPPVAGPGGGPPMGPGEVNISPQISVEAPAAPMPVPGR